MGKPNLFEIATKELSQDAFITWFLMWADDSCQKFDKDLNVCGKAFVSALIKKQYPDFSEEITKVEAGRQWENIDVWAEVNDQYLIIIEDKTHTGQHSKQLERYKEIAAKWCVENNKKSPICIYLKTGNESETSLNAIENEGYAIFSRRDFIDIFDKYPNIKNDIFLDFYDRMKTKENINNKFKDRDIKEWDWNDWQGFFQKLENKIEYTNWFYVNNPNGGFWCFVLNWDYCNGYPLYIQLEQGKLCFKLSTDPNEVSLPEDKTRGEIRNEFYYLLMEKVKEKGYNEIKKPSRFGNGTYMTFAIVEQKDWLGEGIVNIDEVVKKLNQYLEFLREFIEEYNQK